MPLEADYVAQQAEQFNRELVDFADVYVAIETVNEEGEIVYTWPGTPSFIVPCLWLGGGGSAQERQIAAKVEAPIVASILIGPYAPSSEIKPHHRVTVRLTQTGATGGPFEVLAPPIPRSYGISYRVVLGSV
jgi:hypothetical protein